MIAHFPPNGEGVMFPHGDPVSAAVGNRINSQEGCAWASVCNPRLRCSGKECSCEAVLRKQPAQNAPLKRLNVHLRSCDFAAVLLSHCTSGSCGGHARRLNFMTSGHAF